MSRDRCVSWIVVGICCVIAPATSARAATSMFLKADPIKGESQDKAHPAQIEVLSFNSGVTQSGAMAAGGGMGAGKATIQPFTITKPIDASSPQFFLYACNGKHLPTVVLEVVSAGEMQQPILRYTLGDVIVSSVQTSGAGAGGADRPTEQVSFNFAKINIEYMGQNAKGGAGAKSTAEWDMKTMKGASSGGSGAADGSAAAAATAAPDAGGAGGAAAAPADAGTAAGAAPAAGSAAATPSGGAGGAAPAAGDATTAQPAGAKPLTRAQRERMKIQPAQPVQPAPAQPR